MGVCRYEVRKCVDVSHNTGVYVKMEPLGGGERLVGWLYEYQLHTTPPPTCIYYINPGLVRLLQPYTRWGELTTLPPPEGASSETQHILGGVV